jgi:hypothetical protein
LQLQLVQDASHWARQTLSQKANKTKQKMLIIPCWFPLTLPNLCKYTFH